MSGVNRITSVSPSMRLIMRLRQHKALRVAHALLM